MHKVTGIGGLVVALALFAVSGCSSSDAPNASADSAPTPTADFAQIDGTFDVGGYKLYLHCEGSGSPTIIYFHGWDNDPGSASSHNAGTLPELLRDKYRFCAYDRPNVGQSDSIPGFVTGAEQVRALHALLDAADVDGPYLLLGASLGGLIAYDYLMNFPDGIQAMLLLDGHFPDELELEQFFPQEQQLVNGDWSRSEEKTNQYDLFTQAYALRGGEPDIPVIYLAATPNLEYQIGVPGYDDAIVDLQKKFVSAFPQGVFEDVPSPHYMEPAIPDIIVKKIDELVSKIR